MDDLEYYIEEIERELKQLKESKYTGNIEFQVNLKDGGIANLNCTLRKSIKR